MMRKLLAFVLLLPINVLATTYYVDATGGNDSNDGLSIGAAWKTLAKITSSLASMAYGDSVLLKKGEIWTSQTLSINAAPTGIGADNNRLTFGSYGSGNAPKIVAGSLIATGASWSNSGVNGEYYINICATAQCTSSLVMCAIGSSSTDDSTWVKAPKGTKTTLAEGAYEVSGTSGGYRQLYFKPPAGHSANEYAFACNTYNGINVTIPYVTINGVNVLLGGYPAAISGAISGTAAATYLTVKDTSVKFSFTLGVVAKGDHALFDTVSATYGRGTGLYLSAATAYNGRITNSTSAYNGAELTDVTGWTGNVADRGGIGIQAKSAIIEGNFVHDNGTTSGTNYTDHQDAQIQVATAVSGDDVSGGIIRNNLIYNAPREGIALAYESLGYGWQIYNNVIYNYVTNNTYDLSNSIGIYAIGYGNTSNSGTYSIFNNLLFSDTDVAKLGINIGMPAAGDYVKLTYIKNNIVAYENLVSGDATTFSIRSNRANYTTGEAINNLMYGATNKYCGTGAPCDSSYFPVGVGTGDVSSAPSFTNSASKDFTLTYLSPAIDAGSATNITRTSDHSGNPIWGNHDIGPHEYQPPYTIGTHALTAPSARIYQGDQEGRFRALATSTRSCELQILPENSTWNDLSATDVRPAFGDVTSLTCPNRIRTSFTFTPATSTPNPVFRFKGIPNQLYLVKVDGSNAGTNIVGCGSSKCASNSTGYVEFSWNGSLATAKAFDIRMTSKPGRNLMKHINE